MSEGHSELSRPLLVGRKSDGRAVYDRQAKRELIEICLQSGRSIAAIAREHGLNANLLHNWVVGHRRRLAAGDSAASSFLPVQITRSTPSMPVGMRISAELGNGVRIDLSGLDVQRLPQILKLLNELPCSASTRT